MLEVGAFGVGRVSSSTEQPNAITANGFYHTGLENGMNYCSFIHAGHSYDTNYSWQLGVPMGDTNLYSLKGRIKSKEYGRMRLLLEIVIIPLSTRTDLSKLPPVVKLFADKIEPNDEAAEQPLSFEKLGIGHYLVKGSSGFAKEGWWIEIPTDTHGNKICAVEYQTLENGDLEIKTFKKKLNEDGDIVANLDAPIDIPNNANGEPRWIDIRLNEIKSQK